MNGLTAATMTTQRGSLATITLSVLFFCSGAAALVYEVAWFHLLRLAIGSSAISIALLLGSFMGGMCLGSYALPRCVRERWSPLIVYAVLELGIGVFGAAMPDLLPRLGAFYTELGATGGGSLTWRGAIAAAALLPPTMLMGATLPAVARWFDDEADASARLGRFYGANILGAVFGTVVAGFWLLRVYDVRIASHAAAATNVAIAGVAFALAARTARASSVAPASKPATLVDDASARSRKRAVTFAIALSGFTALGCEIVWTRHLSLLLGATTYTFSLILAVFLSGLGIGTAVGVRIAKSSSAPRRALGVCQLVVAPAILWAAFAIAHVLPYGEPTWIFQPRVYANMPLHYAWDFGRCAVAMLPACVLWGASFPLAIAAAASGTGAQDRLVGGLYAANTVGAILGALGTGLFAVMALGSQGSERGLTLLSAIAALALFAGGSKSSPISNTPRASLRRVALATSVMTAAALCAGAMPRLPASLIAFGRMVDKWDAPVEFLTVQEGISASVAVTEYEGHRSFHVSGKIVASTQGLDMRLQRMLGHLPSITHGAPRTVLVVGCGAGVTAGCFVDWPSVERIVVCEIEPAVVNAARVHMADVNRGVLDDPRTVIVLDDARHYLATTAETFDIITSDPIHPWVRGAAALYTEEYYGLVKSRLRPGGVMTQWVPLYETDPPAVKSQLATLLDAFPFATIWNSDPSDRGYDLVAMARLLPTNFDLTRTQTLIEDRPRVRGSLAECELGSAFALYSTYAGDAKSLAGWLADAQRNVDVSLRLQYLAGLALDHYRDHEIYGAIRANFAIPDGMFAGAEHELDALHARLLR